MANINKSIVVVNEFSVDGSRGNSPGQYVIRYMARDEACENLTPIIARSDEVIRLQSEINEGPQIKYSKSKRAKKKDEEQKTRTVDDEDKITVEKPFDYDNYNYITRYMARDTATEVLIASGVDSTSELIDRFDRIQGYSGVAFSRDSISLKHEDVIKKADEIQAEFDKGKPVMKTVISFDTDYLKEMGVLPDDLEVNKRGDLKGNVDQGKLRIAIQDGLKNISGKYSDLDYIGVIQVDTKHVHCHLAMVDKGNGKRFTKNGQQKGMIDADMKMAIKRGIDNSLDMAKPIKTLTTHMDLEHRNTVSYVRRFVNKVIEERGIPQYLIACLPKDRKDLWKASINTDGGDENIMTVEGKKIIGNMKKANAIMRDYVIGILERPDSRFQETLRMNHMLLEARRDRGEFDGQFEYRKRGKKGEIKAIPISPDDVVRREDEKFKEKTITKCMNAVYNVLKGIEDESFVVRTPFIDAMTLPYEEMLNYVKDDKLIEFGFKLRSYSSRLNYHKKQYEKVNEFIHYYEDGPTETYDPGSKVLYDFAKVEQEYNHSLMCKYQNFIHFYHVRDEYKDDYEELMIKRHTVNNRMAMRNDKRFKKMKPEKAEEEGRNVYGLKNADLLVMNPQAYDDIMNDEIQDYMRSLRNFREQLAGYGLLYDEDTGDVTDGLQYDFDDVKAYDLHHMLYDYTYDFPISVVNIDNFVEMANRRYEAMEKARDYLELTGQLESLKDITNEADVVAMKDLADNYRKTGDNFYHNKYDETKVIEMDSSTIRLRNPIYNRSLDNKQLMQMFNLMLNTSMSETEEDEVSGITVIREDKE